MKFGSVKRNIYTEIERGGEVRERERVKHSLAMRIRLNYMCANKYFGKIAFQLTEAVKIIKFAHLFFFLVGSLLAHYMMCAVNSYLAFGPKCNYYYLLLMMSSMDNHTASYRRISIDFIENIESRIVFLIILKNHSQCNIYNLNFS